jgi:hypothetical protein
MELYFDLLNPHEYSLLVFECLGLIANKPATLEDAIKEIKIFYIRYKSTPIEYRPLFLSD